VDVDTERTAPAVTSKATATATRPAANRSAIGDAVGFGGSCGRESYPNMRRCHGGSGAGHASERAGTQLRDSS
jgi:hypothetical protein